MRGSTPGRLVQTNILRAIALVVVNDLLPSWQIKTFHRDLVLSVRRDVLTSDHWINAEQWYIILYVYVWLESPLPQFKLAFEAGVL